MALDRQSIEKKDFPVGRRGYDPDAVDAHLNALADEIDEFKQAAHRKSETLASSASEQVRAIVEAAETSAAEIQRQAEEEALEIRGDATSEAHNTREQATEEARDYVGKVSESTSAMLQRLDAMESELSTLIESLRAGSNRLNADLQLLEGNLGEVGDAVSPRPRFEPESEHEPTVVRETKLEPEPQRIQDDAAAVEAHSGQVADDNEGARLIALNMALNGTPREKTERYLADNFQLGESDGLLDEVYASVNG